MTAGNKINEVISKPFSSYNGGKGSDGTFQKIINKIPPHDLYGELFLGNGTIFRKKKPAQYSILIDKDTAVIEKWKKIQLPPGTKLLNSDSIEFLKHFNCMANILNYSELKTFLYLDPPYPFDTRKSNKNLYKCELNTQDHINILEVVRSLSVNILISSYPNKLYSDYLKNWNTLKFQAMTRKGVATEQIWYNYDEPTKLHDYSYIGDNFRERERLKGIISRNVSKLNQMPAVELNAILENLK